MRAERSGLESASTTMMRLLALGRHFVPMTWRPRLRSLLFPFRPLTFSQPSGVRLRIANDTDWTIYTEVFRKGEYDAAIDRTLASTSSNRLCIVDLGANVGFFTLRVVDAIRSQQSSFDVALVAVEGSPRRVAEFRARVFDENDLTQQVRLISGLVGDRSGATTLYDGASHGDSSIFRRAESSAIVDAVEFVDLTPIFASEPVIHLLKCDIEGAELQFIHSYRELLQKTQVAIFELHDQLCDTDACRHLLREYGFSHEATVRRAGPYELHCVWR